MQLSTNVFVMELFKKKTKRDRKLQQKSKLDRRLCSVCTKLDEDNVEAGIRMVAGDDKVADFTVDSYAALKLKHRQRTTCSVSDPHRYRLFFNIGVFCPQGSHVLPQRL